MQETNAFVETGQGFEIPGNEGIAQAWERMLSSSRMFFYRRAYQLLGNAADAEDAVQDALLSAYTHLDQFRGQARMSSWLTSIVLNSARMQLRRRRNHVQVPLDEPSGEMQTLSVLDRLRDHRPNPEDEYRDSELSARLSHFHRRLTPTLRRTFQLRDIDGLSIRETARILGVPCGTVKARSARARKKLKEFMRQAVGPRSSSLPASAVIQCAKRSTTISSESGISRAAFSWNSVLPASGTSHCGSKSSAGKLMCDCSRIRANLIRITSH